MMYFSLFPYINR